MTINKLLIAMALGLALTACSKPEQAQDAAADQAADAAKTAEDTAEAAKDTAEEAKK